MHPAIAVEFTAALLVVVAVISVVLLILIIVAPWRKVREEPPMDKAVEAKLLMHRNPDEPTGEVPRVSPLTADDGDDDLASGNLDDLNALGDPDEPPETSGDA